MAIGLALSPSEAETETESSRDGRAVSSAARRVPRGALASAVWTGVRRAEIEMYVEAAESGTKIIIYLTSHFSGAILRPNRLVTCSRAVKLRPGRAAPRRDKDPAASPSSNRLRIGVGRGAPEPKLGSAQISSQWAPARSGANSHCKEAVLSSGSPPPSRTVAQLQHAIRPLDTSPTGPARPGGRAGGPLYVKKPLSACSREERLSRCRSLFLLWRCSNSVPGAEQPAADVSCAQLRTQTNR